MTTNGALLSVYGFIKPDADAHTMGIQSAAGLLRDCGYETVLADHAIEHAFTACREESAQKAILDWLISNRITRIGVSYRLDAQDAVRLVGALVEMLKKGNHLFFQGGTVDFLFFGGLPASCKAIEKEFRGLVHCFSGGESARETLEKMGVPEDRIPVDILENSQYDQTRLAFGRDIVQRGNYLNMPPSPEVSYPAFGTRRDTVELRLVSRRERPWEDKGGTPPLIRAHMGPFSSDKKRIDSVCDCLRWAKQLADTGYTDILSLGTSQLTQSNFGEDWEGRLNGGGVPVNSPDEFRMIYDAARPMLVRTYAGTKRIPELAAMYEETLNIAWHALSFWWFNLLDERGPYDLLTNLREHFETLRFIAASGKAFEANVSHHFAFRGCDDVTYIASVYLICKLAKKLGIRTFILQNMLNTPRATWGIQDLAKSRALLKMTGELCNDRFQVLLQPRAGLDYFKPDPEEAKAQLAAVTCLMDDIDPLNTASPPLIHVVSYSEASHLATPTVIDESIRITLYTLKSWREARRRGDIENMSRHEEVRGRTMTLYSEATALVHSMEKVIPNLYTPEGLFLVFAAGFFPVPYLWRERETFQYAVSWQTRLIRGGMHVIDPENGKPMSMDQRIAIAASHLDDANRLLLEQPRRKHYD